MIVLAALLQLGQAIDEWPGQPVELPPGCQRGDKACDPWAEFSPGPARPTDEIVWVEGTTLGDIYHVVGSEVRRDDPVRNQVTFWMNGDHKGNNRVKYRRGLWNITFDCEGRMRYNAFTTMKADGTVLDQSDQMGRWILIRPQSIFQSAERKLCAAQ